MKRCSQLLGILAMVALAGVAKAEDVVVDCGDRGAAVRALHGVNGGPIHAQGIIDLSDDFKRVGVPLVRLHDINWPNADVVDVHTVFPDMLRDPSAAGSYDFAPTDEYVQSIRNVGADVVYRLGESIEHSKRKYHVNPPTDVKRWAEVCAGIVRHYEEGWAGGMHKAVRYWEIWNEPENRPAMWTGDDEQFLNLYVTTARAIKQQTPDARVGGPAFGYVGNFHDGKLEPTPFVEKFLARCKQDGAALDFFSWHTYTNDPHELASRAVLVRKMLDAHGFEKTESHLNEWAYLPGNRWDGAMAKDAEARERFFAKQSETEGAAFVTAALLLLQDAPLDAACYYSADTQGFGMFTEHGRPKKVFYAFEAFEKFSKDARQLRVNAPADDHLVVGASIASDGSRVIVLISNFSEHAETLSLKIKALPWSGAANYSVLMVDGLHDLNAVATSNSLSQVDVPAQAASEIIIEQANISR